MGAGGTVKLKVTIDIEYHTIHGGHFLEEAAREAIDQTFGFGMFNFDDTTVKNWEMKAEADI